MVTVKIHKDLPDGYVLCTSCFDFVNMDLYKNEVGYTMKEEPYILASPNGDFQEFEVSDMLEYHLIEKYVKNKQLFIKKQNGNIH